MPRSGDLSQRCNPCHVTLLIHEQFYEVYACNGDRPPQEDEMEHDEQEDTTVYTVVINEEEQYSIWPARREVPAGWRSVEKQAQNPNALPISTQCGQICGR